MGHPVYVLHQIFLYSCIFSKTGAILVEAVVYYLIFERII